MMLAPMFALTLQAMAPIQPPPAAPVQSVPLPADWSALPPLPYRDQPKITATMDGFVAGEIGSRRCAVARRSDGHFTVRVDLAVLIGADGAILKTTPRAIQCPTVEQYSAGLVSSFARDNLLARPGRGTQWYATAITFDWWG